MNCFSNNARQMPAILLVGLLVLLFVGGTGCSTSTPKTQTEIGEEHGKDTKAADDQGDTLLHTAASSGNIAAVQFLISQGADVHAKNTWGMTPLDAAKVNNKTEVVQYLESLTNQPKENSEAPVPGEHQFTAAEQAAIDKFLAEFGKDVKAKDDTGTTLLHKAAARGNLAAVKYLISQGADVNAKTRHSDHYGSGQTPLIFASDMEIVKYLVSQGADVNARTDSDGTPLWGAVYRNQIEKAKYLVSQGADVNASDDRGLSPLWLAAEAGRLELVEYLVSQGADVNAKQGGKTPLNIAKEKGRQAIVEYLSSVSQVPKSPAAEQAEVDKFVAEFGRDVKAMDKDGQALLHKAARQGNVAIAKYLVSQGADVNMRDVSTVTNGRAPLHFAAVDGHLDFIKYLVSQGADVDARNKNGTTPLWYASNNGRLEVAKFLVSQGADVHAQNNNEIDGNTPINTAKKKGHTAVAEYLESVSQAPKSPAAEQAEFDKFFAEFGKDVKAKGKDDDTLLHQAAKRGSVVIAKYLVDQGADVNAKNNVGRTPLHFAAIGGHLEFAQYLVSQGADVDAKKDFGTTPLWYASTNGRFEVVKFFISQGANVNAQGVFGRFPLHGAAERGHLEIVKYLHSQGADVTVKEEAGKTPLDLAKENGKTAVMEYLSALSQDPSSK